MKRTVLIAAMSVCLTTGPLIAATIDGTNIPSEGLTLRATQDTPTGFGNSGGNQSADFGSELNQLFADIDGNTLKIGMTGNLEGNFNKLWIFFDAVAGGEASLAGDNSDGGFGEINAMTGLSFNGATMDHGIRVEVGGGFFGVNAFDLIDNSAGSIFSGGGPGDLPLVNAVGGFGTTVGWDNSNTAGVSDIDASGAATATTGWEFEIDIPTFFGSAPRATNITAFVSNGGGDFLSNQALPGIGGGGNLGDPEFANLGFITVPVPEPTTATLAMASLFVAGAVRRRKN